MEKVLEKIRSAFGKENLLEIESDSDRLIVLCRSKIDIQSRLAAAGLSFVQETKFSIGRLPIVVRTCYAESNSLLVDLMSEE